jgi:hypothetical protein
MGAMVDPVVERHSLCYFHTWGLGGRWLAKYPGEAVPPLGWAIVLYIQIILSEEIISKYGGVLSKLPYVIKEANSTFYPYYIFLTGIS